MRVEPKLTTKKFEKVNTADVGDSSKPEAHVVGE